MENVFNKRILYIAYFYPPLGGPGVQRPVKTIKYLKKNGWDVDVLTVSDILFHSYDYELLKESCADNIYRTDSLDLMRIYKKFKCRDAACHVQNCSGDSQSSKSDNRLYFNTSEKKKRLIRGLFPIDDKIGWFPYACKKALSLIKEKKYTAIIATTGPHTSGMLAYYLHKKTNIPYFIDYRDHWTLETYPRYLFKFLLLHARYCEKKMLENARGVFTVSELKKEKMITHFGEYLRDKIECVYNGFDEEDFVDRGFTGASQGATSLTGVSLCDTFCEAPVRSTPCAKHPYKRSLSLCEAPLHIRYVGGFSGHRSVEYFIQALKELKASNEIPDNVVIEFIGNYFVETLSWLNSSDLIDIIRIVPQVTHLKAVNYMQSANLLLLFVSTAEGEDFLPGKVFEYIRSNVPILAMVPENGEPAMILRKLGHKYICNMEDVESIKCFLKDFFIENARRGHVPMSNSCSNQESNCQSSIVNYNKYSRENQSQIFIDFLKRKLYNV